MKYVEEIKFQSTWQRNNKKGIPLVEHCECWCVLLSTHTFNWSVFPCQPFLSSLFIYGTCIPFFTIRCLISLYASQHKRYLQLLVLWWIGLICFWPMKSTHSLNYLELSRISLCVLTWIEFNEIASAPTDFLVSFRSCVGLLSPLFLVHCMEQAPEALNEASDFWKILGLRSVSLTQAIM